MLQRTVVAIVFVAAAAALAARESTQTPNLPGLTTPSLKFQGDATRDDEPLLVKPVVLQEVKPQYTPEAMRAKVQGSVAVQIVVAADGSVARARVVQVTWTGDSDTDFTEATPSLVANALTSAKAWKFKPGTLNGAPVRVLTTVTLTFRLH